ncbi:MAG: hypothetical protein EP338_06625 [Bacteroidetes bacterium]|nr:MAG: hypothetical protein EP338_06625 [Bacteroidota bacterium]
MDQTCLIKKFILSCSFILSLLPAWTQRDSSFFRRVQDDSLSSAMNMDAVYNRPFLALGKSPVAVGGYLEGNYQYAVEDGVSEGHQLEARRLTLFISSSVGRRMKFLSEIEFEEGGREINIEFAALDVEFHPLLNLRSGIVMNPIGAFNQNHDGPKWEFVDRPYSATQMLPATWSNAGFGLFGKYYQKQWMFAYECYLTGGFDQSIIENEENKTFLPAAKQNPHRFEEISSGRPLLNGKIATRHKKIGEIALSYMRGIYNTFEADGLVVDQARRLDVLAIDYQRQFPKWHTQITAEWAWIQVDIPDTYTQQFGGKQQGGYLDIVQPIYRKAIGSWSNPSINLACRLEYVDWNNETFRETGGKIGDELWSIMPGISFRPNPQSVFRLNYRYRQQKDLLGNPPALMAAVLFGFSCYF